jgi:hypothetical protein
MLSHSIEIPCRNPHTLTLFKHTSSTTLVCGTTDWCKIVEDKTTNTCYNDLLLAATDNEMLYKDFHEEIKKAGEEMALLVKSMGDDCFLFNQDYLPPQ